MKQLTGKAREDFIEWLNYNYAWEDDVDNIFQSMPQSAQFGLIQEWSTSIYFLIECRAIDDWNHWGFVIHGRDSMSPFFLLHEEMDFDTQEEAQRESVKKLSEIYNK